MAIKAENNAYSYLAAPLSSGGLSLSVNSGTGSLFPSISTNEYFYATITESSLMEIVKVTARSSDTFTITRAQDGTTAQAFTTAARIEQRWNKAQVFELISDYANNGVLGIGSGVSYIDVSFSKAMASASYKINFSFECSDANPIFLSGIVYNKTTTGFSVLFNAPTDSANYKLNYSVGVLA